MASKVVMTLAGVGEGNLGDDGDCRCVLNTRTKRGVKVCRVPKSKKHRSGVAFRGSCTNPTRTK